MSTQISPQTIINTFTHPVASQQVVAGFPCLPLWTGSVQFPPPSCTRDQLVRAGPGINAVIKPRTWRHEHKESPTVPPANYIALSNDPTEIKPMRRMFRSSKWSKSQQCVCVCVCACMLPSSLTNHKVQY